MAFGPTPDADRKTVAWAGVNTDGSPCEGQIVLRYDGPVMLDDTNDPTQTPVSIYPTRLVMPLVQRTLILDQGDGTTVTQIVGYAEAQVPASNDPDLAGNGGTYTVVESLSSRNGLTRSVVIDVGAVGTIWLNRLTSVSQVTGEPVPTVTLADLVAVRGGLASVTASVAAVVALSASTSAQVADALADLADLDDWPDLSLIVTNALI